MLSRRVTIQWPPEPAGDDTSTMVVVSNESHFVDIRVFKNHYPIVDEHPKTKFSEVFEWCMTGDEVEQKSEDPDKYIIQFTHEIDSLAVMKSIEEKKPLEECRGDPDIGTFSKIEGSTDRKETGSMLNPATGRVQDYIEVWRSLDAVKHTPEKDVHVAESGVKSYVLRTQADKYEGQLIRSGNWAQGLVYNKDDKEVPLCVVRAYFDEQQEDWVYLIKYGPVKFPLAFSGAKNDQVIEEAIEWTCVESNF